MIRRPPRSTLDRSSAASDVYKRQPHILPRSAIGGFPMRLAYLLAACAAFIAVPSAQAVPADSPATAVGHDTECLLLFLVAAGDAKEPKVQQAAIAGSWYFLGKVDGRAPGLDIVSALR